ncbi:membrane protein CcdC involved in cytochrome C biogenesis [Actinoplanes octamycinicus]|uniref:Membrane protein CcdC involved in cytochrome C biogenesis n=1 Tax=Actinoplanes octamycinicus TaxID=135948 RepID=A0A7W7GY01_9ACTN|nr:DUF1453 family protein [Actinoplanes octamycinicus]MBB4740379.1 membrane protein CcdC involved in cytochrome C biogenesis [Actinoplanes octamycinicus]GIE59640.1 hypothetical protein Aoc01nite_50420 [Actinoplanes octamycinicus]
MSDPMRDALIFSAILMTIVLFTQVGRHRFGFIKLTLPLVLVVLVAFQMLSSLEFTAPNMTAAGTGIAIGAVIGIGLLRTMRLERDDKNGRIYTRAGLVYLAIWLTVLVGRLIFIWSLENVDGFAVDFGKWIMENEIDPDGVTAFFVLMAMAMVLTRTVGVAIRWIKALRAGKSAPATVAVKA